MNLLCIYYTPYTDYIEYIKYTMSNMLILTAEETVDIAETMRSVGYDIMKTAESFAQLGDNFVRLDNGSFVIDTDPIKCMVADCVRNILICDLKIANKPIPDWLGGEWGGWFTYRNETYRSNDVLGYRQVRKYDNGILISDVTSNRTTGKPVVTKTTLNDRRNHIDYEDTYYM